MRYTEFRDAIREALHHRSAGLTWQQLQARLNLPYDRPCPAWTKQLEREIGLSRTRAGGRSLVWRIGKGAEDG